MAKYSLEDFKKILRTGITPDGRQIESKNMLWKITKELNDLETNALYKFLKSLDNETAQASVISM